MKQMVKNRDRILVYLVVFYMFINLVLCDFVDPVENEDESEEEEEIEHRNITYHPVQKPCDQEKLLTYLARLQAITPENIINMPTYQKANELCKSVSENLESTQKYMQTCRPPHEKNLYYQLIEGVQALFQKLCNNEVFRTEFLRHFKCYQQLSEEYEDCSGPADWVENEDKDFVCKSYQDVCDCYFVKTALLCGREAAKVLKDLSLAIINKIVLVRCANVKREPDIKSVIADGNKIVLCKVVLLVVPLTFLL